MSLEDDNLVMKELLKEINLSTLVNTLDFANKYNYLHNDVVGCMLSLQAIGDFIENERKDVKSWDLTDEGNHITLHGSHEFNVYAFVKQTGKVSMADVQQSSPYAKVGLSKALANGWIKRDKVSNSLEIAIDDLLNDEIQQELQFINEKQYDKVQDIKKQDYKKRKLIKEISFATFDLKKGKNFNVNGLLKQETELTAEMIANGSWKDLSFKPYNFDALGIGGSEGHLHPLLKVRQEFRQIFLEMGFEEMPTNNFIESSFWNFDALFQPQQHPARDAHDTFFLSHPKNCLKLPEDYLERVKTVHSKGGYGSQGYNYDWSIEESRKNLLRTHTTAVSAKMLYNLAQEEKFRPAKYFSIDRVFRNETLDATHLAEFHQVEGVIADYDLTLGDLIGVLYEFFKKLGITQLKFKPAYNPYTEPSMEIFCYHPGLKKWMEVGNSGMFRPEMLLPMGLPKNVNVIAWGLSLERPTMIKYHINNIRDLVGPRVQLKMIYENPLCRLEK